MITRPKADVAVVVPTFNRLDLLKETVAALESQTLESVRFIIVDDHSDRPTRDYLENLSSRDSRFVLIEKSENEPQGCQVSRNLGLDACDAEALVFLDSDDLLAPNALEKRFRQLSQSPQASMIIAPQAIFSDSVSNSRWVNVPRPGVNDIDRFLEITHPIDVPWVNGGVMFRVDALKSSNVRWRPDFDWDDVAFHFECLISGMHAVWMDFDGEPDSWYRMHAGPRYGGTLSTKRGRISAARMIGWMYRELECHQLVTAERRSALMRALYRACVLPSIDAGEIEIARALIQNARGDGLLNEREAKQLSTYALGRKTLSLSDRATFYWNRFSDRRLLASFIDDRPSTYASVPVNLPASAIH